MKTETKIFLRLLIESKLTQKEFAEKTSCTQAQISNYKKGKSIPLYSTLARMAEILNIEINL